MAVWKLHHRGGPGLSTTRLAAGLSEKTLTGRRNTGSSGKS
jgi:hypothetical protein